MRLCREGRPRLAVKASSETPPTSTSLASSGRARFGGLDLDFDHASEFDPPFVRFVPGHSPACPRRNSRHQPAPLRSLEWNHRSDDTSGALATGNITQLIDWLDRHGTAA